MQDQYVADVGDFGKYGLLRHLFGNAERWRLGVVWCLCPSNKAKNDGRFIQYVSDRRFASCDVDLHGCLSALVQRNHRSVCEIERSTILGTRTIYFSEVLDFDGMPAFTAQQRTARRQVREEWLERALATTAGCNAIFLDPDNGLEVQSVLRHEKQAPKFVYFDEIGRFTSRGQTAVIYHHLNRHKDHGSHDQQMRDRRAELKRRVAVTGDVLCLRYRPYSPRAFFIVTTKDAHPEVEAAVNQFMRTPWSKYFERFE